MSPFASLVVVAFVLAIGVLIFAIGLARATKGQMPAPTKNAAPAPDQPLQRVQGRATTTHPLCARQGHTIPEWAFTRNRWPCVVCREEWPLTVPDARPFDQAVAELEAAYTERSYRKDNAS